MKVILIDEIRGLGTRGDVVNVKDGYARNFLLPKQLAREATQGNMKAVEQERKKWAALASQEKTTAEELGRKISGLKLSIHKRAGDGGTLFGSVTSSEIADALAAQGVEIDKRRVEVEHPIKTTGTHSIDVRLHRDVSVKVDVEVLPLEEAQA